jgi:hypothetical protein
VLGRPCLLAPQLVTAAPNCVTFRDLTISAGCDALRCAGTPRVPALARTRPGP